jgi:hypothetical protein
VDYIFNNYWKQVVSSAGAFSLRITGTFWIVYNILLSRLLVKSAMRFVANDIHYHVPQYGPRWYSFGLVIRLFFTSFSISIFLESVHIVCDHFLSKVTTRSSHTDYLFNSIAMHISLTDAKYLDTIENECVGRLN